MSQVATSTSVSQNRMQLGATLIWQDHSFPLSVLIDSGADDSFIDFTFVRHTNIPVIRLCEAQTVNALGRLLADVTHQTITLTLIISGNYCETISLLVITSPLTPVLGFPWLKLHNPQFNWSNGSVISWSIHCHANCLSSANTAPPLSFPQSLEPPDHSPVPPDYHDLAEDFSNTQALSLLPHRPY